MDRRLQCTVVLFLCVVMEPAIVYSGERLDNVPVIQVGTPLFKRFKVESPTILPARKVKNTFAAHSAPSQSSTALQHNNKQLARSEQQSKLNNSAALNETDNSMNTVEDVSDINLQGSEAPPPERTSNVNLYYDKETSNASENISTTSIRAGENGRNVTNDLTKEDNTFDSFQATAQKPQDIHQITIQDNSLLRNYKILGGDDDEDSARWAVEEVARKLQAEPLQSKSNAGPSVASDEQGNRNRESRKELFSQKTDTGTSAKQNESSNGTESDKQLSSSQDKYPNANTKPQVIMCSHRSSDEKHQQQNAERNQKICTNVTITAVASENRTTSVKPLPVNNNLNNSTLSDQTSRVKCVKTTETAKSPPINGTVFGNKTHQSEEPKSNPCKTPTVLTASLNGNHNQTNIPILKNKLDKKERKKLVWEIDVHNRTSLYLEGNIQDPLLHILQSHQKQSRENQIQNKTLKLLNQMVQQKGNNVALNMARIHDETNQSSRRNKSHREGGRGLDKLRLSTKPSLQTFNASGQILEHSQNKSSASPTELVSEVKPANTLQGQNETVLIQEKAVNGSTAPQLVATTPLKPKSEGYLPPRIHHNKRLSMRHEAKYITYNSRPPPYNDTEEHFPKAVQETFHKMRSQGKSKTNDTAGIIANTLTENLEVGGPASTMYHQASIHNVPTPTIGQSGAQPTINNLNNATHKFLNKASTFSIRQASYSPNKANIQLSVTPSQITTSNDNLNLDKLNLSMSHHQPYWQGTAPPQNAYNGKVTTQTNMYKIPLSTRQVHPSYAVTNQPQSNTQKLYGTGYSGQAVANSLPLKSTSWWGNSLQQNPTASAPGYSVLPGQPFAPTLSPAPDTSIYRPPSFAGNSYEYRRNIRQIVQDDLSSELTESKHHPESTDQVDVKPNNKGTIVFKLLPKNTERNNTSNSSGAISVEGLIHNSNKHAHESNRDTQRSNDNAASKQTSTITLNLSNYQNIRGVQEDQESDINSTKQESDTPTNENRKSLELKIVRKVPRQSAKYGEDGHQTHQEIRIKLGSGLNQGQQNNVLGSKDSVNHNSATNDNSNDMTKSQTTDGDAVITESQTQTKVHSDKGAEYKKDPDEKNDSKHNKNTEAVIGKLTNMQQIYNSDKEDHNAHESQDNNKQNGRIISPSTTAQQSKSTAQSDAVAHVVIHDLSGKPVFKGKVNFFLPNHTNIHLVRNISSISKPQEYRNKTGSSSVQDNVSTTSSGDTFFQNYKDKGSNSNSNAFRYKSRKLSFGASLQKIKNPKSSTKPSILKHEDKASATDLAIDDGKDDEEELDWREVNQPMQSEQNSIDITDFNSAKYPKDHDYNLNSSVNIPLVEKQLNKEVTMNDQLMITENTDGNVASDSKTGNKLTNEPSDSYHDEGNTHTIKGIKSVTIALQKGNESIPIIQQLVEPKLSTDSVGEHSAFQVTTTSLSDEISSSGANNSENETPSLSVTVTTNPSNSNHSMREENKMMKESGNVFLFPSKPIGGFEDQKSVEIGLTSHGHKHRNVMFNDYLTKALESSAMKQRTQSQQINKSGSKAKNVEINQRLNGKTVTLSGKPLKDFQAKLHTLKLPEEQKISIVNEKQKLVIPLALAQEYKQAYNDQALPEQENVQSDLTLQPGVLTGLRPGNEAVNVVTVGDPREHKWVNCRATPSTKDDDSLTILNCDKKEPSGNPELEAEVDPRLPSVQNYLPEFTETAGVGYPISRPSAAQQPTPKQAAPNNHAIAQDINQKILNSVNSELKAEGNLITSIVAESTQIKRGPQQEFNVGENSYFTENPSPVTMPQASLSAFWGAGTKPRPFNLATFHTPFVHQFLRPLHHSRILGPSIHRSLPLATLRTPYVHQIFHPPQHRLLGRDHRPLPLLNSLHTPLVHHFSRGPFNRARDPFPLALARRLLLRSALHKRYHMRTPQDGPPGKRASISRNTLKNNRRISKGGVHVKNASRPCEGEWAYLGRVFCCCPCCM